MGSESVEYLEWLRVERGRSRATIDAYRRDISTFSEWLLERGLEVSSASDADVDSYFADLRTRRAPTSVARMMASVKGLYRFALDEGLLSHDPTISLRPVRRPRSLPKPLAQESMAQLLDSVSSGDYSGLRDRAVLEFLYGTGARVSEVVGLRLGDVDWIEETALLRGKGGKQRLVPLGREVARSLRSYLQNGRILISTDSHDRVFLNQRGGPLSRQGIDAIIRKRALAAGIPALGLSAHVFRHSCATHMLEHGADIRVVQELLGHASIATTQLYTAVSIPTLRRDYLAAHPRASK